MEVAGKNNVMYDTKLFIMPKVVMPAIVAYPTDEINIIPGQLWPGYYCGSGYFSKCVSAQVSDNFDSIILTRLMSSSDPNYGAGCLQLVKAGSYEFSYKTNGGYVSVDEYSQLDNGKFKLKQKQFVPVTQVNPVRFTLESNAWLMFGFVCRKDRIPGNEVYYGDICLKRFGI